MDLSDAVDSKTTPSNLLAFGAGKRLHVALILGTSAYERVGLSCISGRNIMMSFLPASEDGIYSEKTHENSPKTSIENVIQGSKQRYEYAGKLSLLINSQ